MKVFENLEAKEGVALTEPALGASWFRMAVVALQQHGAQGWGHPHWAGTG